MRVVRRILQVVALLGTLIIGILAFSIIVSQTPWFKTWLRRYIVREANQYLNGELSIGRLDGNLFFGVELADVSVTLNGERVISVKDAGLDYSVFEIVSEGISLDDVRLNQPVVHLRRTEKGWNLASLVKKQRQEANRRGPNQPMAVGEIGISDGTFVIDSPDARIPDRIERVDASLSFAYEPVHYTVGINHLSLRAVDPSVALNKVTGTVSVRDDNLYLDNVSINTAESAIEVDGYIEQYLGQPSLNLKVTSEKISLPEFAALVPALEGVALQPTFEVALKGPASRLDVNLDVRTPAGDVKGHVTADVLGPERAAAGRVQLTRLNLGPILANPERASDITGTADFDLAFPSQTRPISGTFDFVGPHAAAFGYEAADVRARGRIDDRTIVLTDASGRAYGAYATTAGRIVRPASAEELIAFDLKGRVANLDTRRLPPQIKMPRLASNIHARYHVAGTAARLRAEGLFDRSIIEGATVGVGSTAALTTGNRQVGYAFDGNVADVNLQRFGRALRVNVLAADRFVSDLNGEIHVSGSGTTLDALALDARGNLADSTIGGAQVPQMTFESKLADRVLSLAAQGGFLDLNPATFLDRKNLAGQLDGTLDLRLTLSNLGEPVTPDTIAAEGRIQLIDSHIGDVQIRQALADGRYANRVATLSNLQATGPDVDLVASGTLAVDRSSQSHLEYHARSADLREIGRILSTPLQGSAITDGVVTGNLWELHANGHVTATDVAYRDISALNLSSEYWVAIPEFDRTRLQAWADTRATFLKVAGRELKELTATTTYTAPQFISFDAKALESERTLEAAGDMVVHPDHNEIHLGQLRLSTGEIAWAVAPGTTPAIQYSPSAITVQNLVLQSGDQQLTVTGSMGRTAPAATPLTVQATNVDVARIDQMFLGNRGLGGRLGANANITGTVDAPVVNAQADLVMGTFRQFKFDSLSARIDSTATTLGIDAKLQQNPQQWLTLKGTVPTSAFKTISAPSSGEHVTATGSEAMDLKVETSTVDLAMIQGFTTEVQNVQGSLQADLQIQGSPRDPHVKGYLDVKQGAITLPATNEVYSWIDSRINFADDRAIVERFEARDTDNHILRVSGELAVHERQVGAFNIKVSSEAFDFLKNELGEVEANVDLTIDGDLRRPRVRGDMTFTEARVIIDRILSKLNLGTYATVETEFQGPPEPGYVAVQRVQVERQPSLADLLSADVHMRFPNNLLVRAQDLRLTESAPVGLGQMNVTLGGDLTARKRPGEDLQLLGDINTIRGTYDFQGRRFELLRDGRVRFEGETVLDPALDINARRVISGVEARIHIGGTMRQPTLDLSSTPPLDQSEILSLIVFNQPINQLGAGEKVALAQKAGALASGFVVTPIVQSLGEALDLDLLEVQPISDEGGGPRVTVGQQVNERLFVKFTQEFGDQELSQFVLEYELAEFLRLQSAISQGARTSRSLTRRIDRGGLDLIFFFSY